VVPLLVFGALLLSPGKPDAEGCLVNLQVAPECVDKEGQPSHFQGLLQSGYERVRKVGWSVRIEIGRKASSFNY